MIKMLFTDLEVGDRIKIIRLRGLDIRKNCCDGCDFMLKNLNKEVEVIDITKIYSNGIMIQVSGKGTKSLLINNTNTNNYKIIFVKE